MIRNTSGPRSAHSAAEEIMPGLGALNQNQKKLVDKLPGCLHHSFDCPSLSGGAAPAHLLYLTKFLSNDVSFFGQNLSFF